MHRYNQQELIKKFIYFSQSTVVISIISCQLTFDEIKVGNKNTKVERNNVFNLVVLKVVQYKFSK